MRHSGSDFGSGAGSGIEVEFSGLGSDSNFEVDPDSNFGMDSGSNSGVGFDLNSGMDSEGVLSPTLRRFKITNSFTLDLDKMTKLYRNLILDANEATL
jgi:hypothetical protein